MKKKILMIWLMLGVLQLLCSCHRISVYQPVAAQATGKGDIADVASSLMWDAAGIAIILIVATFILVRWIYRLENGKWNRFWQCLERNISIIFGLTWIWGFCIYCAGMYIADGPTDALSWDSLERLLGVAPMAVIHAFEMFLLESDIGAIHEEFHSNLFFMTCFSLVHFLAAFVSLLFVIKHFGYNMVARLHLWMTTHNTRKVEKLYMFWGMNEPSYYLAKDIEDKDKGNSILFVKTADEEETTGNISGINRLFDFLSLKNKELDKLKELGCLSTTAFSRLSKCEINDEDRKNGCSVFKKHLGLRRVVKLINKTTSELHIFFLGEDEESNITATSNICCDTDLINFATGNRKVTIYCHARHDSINRVVEDAQSNGNIEVRIVDSAHGCIKEMMSNEEYHPINFVDIDTASNIGTATSQFTSLIVGFGETGRDAARFLYEFGAFVSKDSTEDDDEPGKTNNVKVRRSPFKCHVVDNNMQTIKQRFLATAPTLRAGDNNAMIEFHQFDVMSEQFHDLLQANCNSLNYVVVALKDDELAISTAVSIFNFIRSNRKDLSKLKIFVRCHNSVYEQHMKSIADHYNQVRFAEHTVENNHIVIYGSVETLYTYDQIIKNGFEEDGKTYNHAYCEASGNKGKKDVWETRHDFLINKNSLDGYSELRRKETQDTANAYHALTKMTIIKKVHAARPDETPCLQKILDGDNSYIPIFQRISAKGEKAKGLVMTDNRFNDVEQLLFRNIARLEHLRWNASHEMLGYCHFSDKENIETLVPEERRHGCNEQYKLHNCILNWEQLDTESLEAYWVTDPLTGKREYPDYKLYDFIVVTTTLQLYQKTLTK